MVKSAHLEGSRSWGQAKPNTMKLVFVASPLSIQHEGERCLPADFCVREPAL
jgi:hypothetical protein